MTMTFDKRRPEPTSKQLFAEIKQAAKALGLKPSTLCLMAVNNAHIPTRLKGGGSVSVETLRRLRHWIDNEAQRRSRNREKAA